MAKVIFILGLCGSGKTHRANEILKTNKFKLIDEGFCDKYEENYKKLVGDLLSENDYIIIDIQFRLDYLRRIIEGNLRSDISDLEIIWECFENDIVKANNNVLKRKNKGDPTGHIEINSIITHDYTIPHNATILPIMEI